MSVSEELRRLRRQFLKEVDSLQRQHDEQVQRTDDRFARVDQHFERLQGTFVAFSDEIAALRTEMQAIRNDVAETGRTATGRMRLLEQRFAQMLEAIAASQVDPAVVQDLLRRVELLERGSTPAA